MVTSQAAQLEAEILAQYPLYRDGLVAARVQAQRRACRVIPGELTCHRLQDDFALAFTLPAGSYATMVIAELISDLTG